MSNLSQIVMDMEEEKAKYDQTMKELLSDRQVLAWILKRFVPEYKDCNWKILKRNIYSQRQLWCRRWGWSRGVKVFRV